MDSETTHDLQYEALPPWKDLPDKKSFGEFYKTVEWDEISKELLQEVVSNPAWIIESSILEPEEVQSAKIALTRLKSNMETASASALINQIEDRDVQTMVVLRQMEILADMYGFSDIWGSADFDKAVGVDGTIVGSFGLDLQDSLDMSENSITTGEPRKRPCLIKIPIRGLIDRYLSSKGAAVKFIFEHSPGEVMETSFELFTDTKIPGLEIYRL